MGTRIRCSSVSSPWDISTFPSLCCGCKWLLWEAWSSRHGVGVCWPGRALLRRSCFNLPFGCVAGTPCASTDVTAAGTRRDVTIARTRRWLGSLQQPPCCLPFPLPPLWPPMAQNAKLRKPGSWEWNTKQAEERRCTHVGHCLLVSSEKKESVEALSYSPLSYPSSFKGLILISIAPLLSTALVCFFSITGESVFYLL